MRNSFKDVFGRVTDVDQLIKNILQTATETNVQQAAARERASSMTVDLVINTENANQEIQNLLKVLPNIYLDMVGNDSTSYISHTNFY